MTLTTKITGHRRDRPVGCNSREPILPNRPTAKHGGAVAYGEAATSTLKLSSLTSVHIEFPLSVVQSNDLGLEKLT
jgi:hypothetical protein